MSNRLTKLLIFCICIALVWMLYSLVPKLRASTNFAYKRAELILAPNAEKAFTYGSQHLDFATPADYDIDKAEFFFRYVANQDPEYPYVHHQLARIEFLRSKFDKAMWHINKEIESHGDRFANSYYIRGLIEGYMGKFDEAALDYEHFLSIYPDDWAAINDYAWVLLKADRPKDAVEVTSRGLIKHPQNPWLLNTNAIALSEIGKLSEARDKVRAAVRLVSQLSEADWLAAYPGNDPRIAQEGVLALQEATRKNMHTIVRASVVVR